MIELFNLQKIIIIVSNFPTCLSAELLQTTSTASPKAQAAAKQKADSVKQFVTTLRTALHNTFRYGQGTRDMAGPSGLTTEKFIDKVREDTFIFLVSSYVWFFCLYSVFSFKN